MYNKRLETEKLNPGNIPSEILLEIEGDENHPGSAGSAMSSYLCRICLKVGRWPNMAPPILCERCAAQTNRCNHCGSLLERYE